MRAVINKNHQIVKYLLELGADIDIKNNDGISALNLTKYCNSPDIINLLRRYYEHRYLTDLGF